MIELVLSRYSYLLFAVLLGVGLYMLISSSNLVKKIIGLNLFQTAVFLFFISTAYVEDGASPVVPAGGTDGVHASPLPHVIVLTAIVVGVALTALGLALAIRINRQYDSLDTTAVRRGRENE